jgi:hypothetical protein
MLTESFYGLSQSGHENATLKLGHIVLPCLSIYYHIFMQRKLC